MLFLSVYEAVFIGNRKESFWVSLLSGGRIVSRNGTGVVLIAYDTLASAAVEFALECSWATECRATESDRR